MPLYEYECGACGARFERLVSIAAADGASCPHCGAAQVRRLLSVIAGVTGRAEAPAATCGGGACAHCS